MIVFTAQVSLFLALAAERLYRRRSLRRHDKRADRGDVKRAPEQNRDLAGRLIASQEVERTRIARDLHDGVCQEVAALSVELSHLRQLHGDVQSAGVQSRLIVVQRRATALAESLRLLSHGLHPSVLNHVGLVAALQSHCAEIERQHHLHVTLLADEEVEPGSQSVALSLFRIAQEALRNAARHGQARHAIVSLAREGNDVALSVADDGQGFDVEAARHSGGLGLVSMEERARFVHGSASIRSRAGAGTLIDVRIPVAVAKETHAMKSQTRVEPCNVQPCC